MRPRAALTLALAAATATATAGIIVTAGPAHAAGVSDFDAPLLGSTASRHWSRLPDPIDLLCKDACRKGLLPGLASENGAAAYIPAGPASWGVLANDPALIGKVARFYQGDSLYAGAQIVEIRPGTPLEPLVSRMAQEDLAHVGVSRAKAVASTSTQSDGWTVWITEAVSPKDRSLDRFQAAYAAKGNEIIRVFCDGAMRFGSAFCGGLSDTALSIARAKLGATIPARTAALAPATPVSGLSPDFASKIDSREFWGNVLQAPMSMIRGLGPQTLALQWSVPDAPALTVNAAVTTLKRQQGLKAFLGTLCAAGNPTCTTATTLGPTPRGGRAAGMAGRPEGETGDWWMEFQAGDNRRVADLQCFAKEGYTRALTPAERTACAKAISSVAAALFPS